MEVEHRELCDKPIAGNDNLRNALEGTPIFPTYLYLARVALFYALAGDPFQANFLHRPENIRILNWNWFIIWLVLTYIVFRHLLLLIGTYCPRIIGAFSLFRSAPEQKASHVCRLQFQPSLHRRQHVVQSVPLSLVQRKPHLPHSTFLSMLSNLPNNKVWPENCPTLWHWTHGLHLEGFTPDNSP